MINNWAWRYDRVIPSDAPSARQVLNDVLGQLESHHWPQQEVFGIHLAAEEALINAIRHGNRLDPAKHIHVVCAMSDDRIRIEVVDEGSGFDPASVPDPTCPDRLHWPCGRGIMLMKAFMSSVQYNAVGNGVVMEKVRKPAETPVPV